MRKLHYKVCAAYVTVKGVAMDGKTYPAESQTESHVTLVVIETGERVCFTRKELL